mgnify:CR=1 FL=1
MPAGTTTVDFGAHPGGTDASVTITGQTEIGSGSLVEAWLMPTSATADHSGDEHLVDGPRVMATDLVAGTGFTIRAQATNPGSLTGTWRVGWVWYTP